MVMSSRSWKAASVLPGLRLASPAEFVRATAGVPISSFLSSEMQSLESQQDARRI
jgi:hypothetical protein